MKKLLIMLILCLGITFSANCQNFSRETDSISLSYEAGLKVFKMKLRNDYLESEILALKLIIDQYKDIQSFHKRQLANKDQQIALLQNNVQNYQDLYNSEKELQPDFWDKFLNTLFDVLIGAGLVAGGYVLGSI